MKNFIAIAGLAALCFATMTACETDSPATTDSGIPTKLMMSPPEPGIDIEFYDQGGPLLGIWSKSGMVFDSIVRIPIKDTSWIPGYASQLSQEGCLVYRPADQRTYIGQPGNWQQFLYLSDALSMFKKAATYSGTTNGSGVYTETFPAAYAVAPNIQASLIGGTDEQSVRVSSVSTTGFTVVVREMNYNTGAPPSWSNVSGADVDVLITQK